MPLTPIRLITSENVGGYKFEKVVTESGAVFYAINGRSVDGIEFEQRVLAAYEHAKVGINGETEEFTGAICVAYE